MGDGQDGGAGYRCAGHGGCLVLAVVVKARQGMAWHGILHLALSHAHVPRVSVVPNHDGPTSATLPICT
jgi:hypothetical protein